MMSYVSPNVDMMKACRTMIVNLHPIIFIVIHLVIKNPHITRTVSNGNPANISIPSCDIGIPNAIIMDRIVVENNIMYTVRYAGVSPVNF